MFGYEARIHNASDTLICLSVEEWLGKIDLTKNEKGYYKRNLKYTEKCKQHYFDSGKCNGM